MGWIFHFSKVDQECTIKDVLSNIKKLQNVAARISLGLFFIF
jgi:hypothetical protein